jgi:gamma-glutamylcyclotransferase (GGCT)/AIG2-like uncharacterized protein YtfP
MEITMNKLFIYGTLLDEEVQKEVLNRHLGGDFGLLDNYIVMRDWEVERIAYPRLYPHSGGCVIGKVVKVTDEELLILDEWETNRYIRQKIYLKSGLEVDSYLANIKVS